MLQIETPQSYPNSFLHLGFRPFFLLATLFSAVAMALWAWLYMGAIPVMSSGMPAITWHAHEMIYGYALAVVSGFLLTSIRNWTGIQTLNGKWLLSLALLWASARLVFLVDYRFAMLLDLSYNLALLAAAAIPLYRARQWKQMSIWTKLVLLSTGNAMFYAGAVGWWSGGIHVGLYTGLYILVSLILMMGRRVIPFFIEKRAGVTVINRKWVDISSLVLMLLFLVVEVFWPQPIAAGICALLLFVLHALRLLGWYAPTIRREPMLWVLYLGYGWLVFAFLLRGSMLFVELNPMLPVHAFAAGGIGMVTIGMMARVSLGHTGRNVYDYPFAVRVAFILVGLAGVFRVLVPLVLPATTTYMVLAAQTLWVFGFTVFVVVYLPMLVKPRVDGRYG